MELLGAPPCPTPNEVFPGAAAGSGSVAAAETSAGKAISKVKSMAGNKHRRQHPWKNPTQIRMMAIDCNA